MRNIDKLTLKLRSKVNDDKKIKVLWDFYMNDNYLSKFNMAWKKKKYDKSLIYVLAFLKKNHDELRLEYTPIATEKECVLLFGKDELDSNHATIKTIGQLLDIQKNSEGSSNKRLLQGLIKNYRDFKNPFLCVNLSTSSKNQCGAIIHEIHAWVLSGCTLSSTSLVAFFYEWRTSIFSISLLKKMDNIILSEI